MKEKVELFAKGVFSYSKATLRVSVNGIHLAVEKGKYHRGSFYVSASDGSRIKGVVYSNDSLMSVENASFSGKDNTVDYIFDATHLDINDSVKGRFSIVTELGEAYIPFSVKICTPACDTSIGPVSDMFQYTNLAQADWSEAKTVFKSEEFRRTLEHCDAKMVGLYDELLKSSNLSLALEEFLTAVHKKTPIIYKTDRETIECEVTNTSITENIVIGKSTWGYAQLGVSVEGDFIVPDRRVIWTEDFSGNVAELQIKIDASKIRPGLNFGKVIFNSYRQSFEVNVVCRKTSEREKERLLERKTKSLDLECRKAIVAFLMGNLAPMRFAGEINKPLTGLKTIRPDNFTDRLIKIYTLIVSGKEMPARTALKIILEDEEWMGKDDRTYAFVLLLEGMLEKDQYKVLDIQTRLKELYANNHDVFAYLFATELDKRGRINRNTKFENLKRGMLNGENSAIIFAQVLNCVNADPAILKEFGPFEQRMMLFGLKYGKVNRNVMMQAAYLASREKKTTPLLIRVLEKAFESFKLNEILEALCLHIVLSGKTDKHAYKWLRIGINEQIRVKDIYEQCVKAAGDALTEALPKPMLTYFENEDNLGEKAREAFYVNTVLYYMDSDSIPFGLMDRIHEYTMKCLGEGKINESLSILYNSVVKKEDLSEEHIQKLPELVFKYRCRIDVPEAGRFLVRHKELAYEESYEIHDKQAIIDLFTEDTINVIDTVQGGRLAPIDVKPERLVTNIELIALCKQNCIDNKGVLISCLEDSKYDGTENDSIDLVRKCVEIKNLDPEFELECKTKLIEYYYENLEGEMMESFLVTLDLGKMPRRERARMIDMMIIRELYSLAYKNMDLYGFFGVDLKRLSKLADRLIETESEYTGELAFLNICYNIFKKNRQTDRIVSYLVRSYRGETDSMYDLWRKACNLGVDTTDIEEKFLGQLLFTESDMKYARDVFMHYYGHGPSKRLIRAFLSYYAYCFISTDRYPGEELLEIMRRESNYEENEICMLALLKDYSQKLEYTDGEKRFLTYHLDKFVQKGVVLPFFKDYIGKLPVSKKIRDKYYLEYHTDPHNTVKIYHCFADKVEDNYTVEEMRHIGYGIFVKEFVLFYDETLQYYISEERQDGSYITEALDICPEPELYGEDETAFHILNLIITSREMNDYKTLTKLMDGYVKTEYMSKRLFKPIISE